jgi:hypothetical protein
LLSRARRSFFRRNWLLALLVPYDLIYAVFYAVTGNWFGVGIMLGLAVLMGFFLRWTHERDQRSQLAHLDGITREQWDKFKAQYPNVLIYDSVDKMLAAHPLSVPDVTEEVAKPTFRDLTVSQDQLDRTRMTLKEAVGRLEKMKKYQNPQQ